VLGRIPRPTPAMVIACVALGVALGGTGWAVTSLPRNSVGTLQLMANAVVSTKVRNGSLLRADFRAGQIPSGPQGAPGPAGPAGPAGAAGPAGPTNAGTSLAVKSQQGADPSSTTSTSFSEVGSLSLDVPAGSTATIVATFSAESVCYGASGWCSVRILIDGNEANPAEGSDFAFDSTDGGTASSAGWEGHSMTRYANSVGAGSHTVSVQYRTTAGTVTLRLDDWALSAVAYKA
jgi:hypothetical protein